MEHLPPFLPLTLYRTSSSKSACNVIQTHRSFLFFSSCVFLFLFAVYRPRVELENHSSISTEGNFTCKVASQPHTVIQWWNGGIDITAMSVTSSRPDDSVDGVSLSTLQVDFLTQRMNYEYCRSSSSSDEVKCKVRISCVAFLLGTQEETQAMHTSVVFVTLCKFIAHMACFLEISSLVLHGLV